MKGRKFPTLGFILLVLALLWLLSDLEVMVVDIPWFPVILIIIALGMIYNRLWR